MKTYGQSFTTDENGIQVFNPFDYLDFYEANIHSYNIYKSEVDELKIYEGMTAEEFQEKHKDGYLALFQYVLKEERLSELQNELEAENKQVCMVNLCILSLFLLEKGRARYLFLMKPTISETLSALKNVSKISFTNKDGTTVESSSKVLIKTVMETLETKSKIDETDHEFEKLVTCDKLADKSVMQSYFVHDLAMFLNKYFPVKRKKDALVSTKEVELILYLMKLVGLSTVELTNKRYWQLMKIYETINRQPTNLSKFNINGKPVIIPTQYIPYSVWKNGKIDWTDDIIPETTIKEGDTIQF